MLRSCLPRHWRLPAARCASGSASDAAGPSPLAQPQPTRSGLFAPVLADPPADAAVASHRLLAQGGYIRQAGLGLFRMLPLGVRVVAKIEALVDATMQEVGGQKLSMPVLMPAELWHKTGRWNSTGAELMRLRDRKGAGLCLGPTHEEAFTDLVATDVFSHRQLPLRLYQIGPKYRDEIRPRFGMLRSREFSMKDMYSFDETPERAVETYWELHRAYSRLFRRIGVPFVAVEADTGNIGGNLSHEFHFVADVGEDCVLRCSCGQYAANSEKALCRLAAPVPAPTPEVVPVREHALPSIPVLELLGASQSAAAAATVQDGLGAASNVHLVAYRGPEDGPSPPAVFALVPAGRQPNPLHFKSLLPPSLDAATLVPVQRAVLQGDAAGVRTRLLDGGAPVVVDESVRHIVAAVFPSLRNAAVSNIVQAVAGDRCGRPNCPEQDGRLLESRGIEVGQVFYLGTKYSSVMGAAVKDRHGKLVPLEMGCYGIGITRIMAAVAEVCRDERGLAWPASIAPFQAVIVTAIDDEGVVGAARDLHMRAALAGVGPEVVLDDRWGERFGHKVAEAELLGYPWVIVVGKQFLRTGNVELRQRRTGSMAAVPLAEVMPRVAEHYAARFEQPLGQ